MNINSREALDIASRLYSPSAPQEYAPFGPPQPSVVNRNPVGLNIPQPGPSQPFPNLLPMLPDQKPNYNLNNTSCCQDCIHKRASHVTPQPGNFAPQPPPFVPGAQAMPGQQEHPTFGWGFNNPSQMGHYLQPSFPNVSRPAVSAASQNHFTGSVMNAMRPTSTAPPSAANFPPQNGFPHIPRSDWPAVGAFGGSAQPERGYLNQNTSSHPVFQGHLNLKPPMVPGPLYPTPKPIPGLNMNFPNAPGNIPPQVQPPIQPISATFQQPATAPLPCRPAPPTATPVPLLKPISSPTKTKKMDSDAELSAQLGYLTIQHDVPPTPPTPPPSLSSEDLHGMFHELEPLASQLSPESKPFDTVVTVRNRVITKFRLPYPNDWSLRIRCHSGIVPSCTVLRVVEPGVNGIKTTEYALKDDDFLFFEYNKRLQATESPLLVLSYIGEEAPAPAKHELVWGLGEMEKEIKVVVRFVLDD